MQNFTQRAGRRPFALSSLVGGFDNETGKAHVYQIDPSGTYYEYVANAIGRSAKVVKEYITSHLEEVREKKFDDESVLKLAVKALDEIAENGAESMEVAVLKRGGELTFLSIDKLKDLVEKVKKEKEAEKKSKKKRTLSTAVDQD